MRPKVVILTMLVAFTVLGGLALFKGLTGNSYGERHDQIPAESSASLVEATGNQAAVPVAGSNAVIVSEQMRAAVIEKEIDRIHDLQDQVNGTNDSIIIAALLDKLTDPETEIRQGAMDALRQLDNTNALPGLTKAVDNAKDPREKVAILDLIDYIKMPSATENVSSESATNAGYHPNPAAITNRSENTNIQYNPAFLKGRRAQNSPGR